MAIFSFKISQLFLRAVLMMPQRKLNAVKTRSESEALVRSGAKARDLAPCCSQFSMVGGWNIVAGNVKEVGDRFVYGNETLKVSR